MAGLSGWTAKKSDGNFRLIGPLIALVVFADECRRWPVNIWVDNAGSVGVWKKGYSSYCRLCTTLVKAISVVAAGLGCRVAVQKITLF